MYVHQPDLHTFCQGCLYIVYTDLLATAQSFEFAYSIATALIHCTTRQVEACSAMMHARICTYC